MGEKGEISEDYWFRREDQNNSGERTERRLYRVPRTRRERNPVDERHGVETKDQSGGKVTDVKRGGGREMYASSERKGHYGITVERKKRAKRKPNQCDVDTKETIGGVGWVEDGETCTAGLGPRGSRRVVRQRRGRSMRGDGEEE